MGAGSIDLLAILKLRKRGLLPDNFSIAEIGAQQLSNSALRDGYIVNAFAEAFNVPPRSFHAASGKTDTTGVETLPDDAPFARDFWEWLGCTYMAADVDTSPHTIPLDLNFDDVPLEHRGKYHLVTNFGTTEHIANQN